MSEESYVVGGTKPWNWYHFRKILLHMKGKWFYFSDPVELKTHVLLHQPRFAFFLHWPWKVPDEVLEAAECVCFHMTDLPYGRGGSPLQNLISRGAKETKLSAIQMTQELDAGPIYTKSTLSLEGTAEQIYIRMSAEACAIIRDMTQDTGLPKLRPYPQTGRAVTFKRRTPAESEMPSRYGDQLYHHIRMLDAETYPRAFIDHGDYRIEFSRAALYLGRIEATATIRKRDGKDTDRGSTP